MYKKVYVLFLSYAITDSNAKVTKKRNAPKSIPLFCWSG